MRTPGSLNRKPGEMTPREIAIVELLRRGYSLPQIGDRLKASRGQVGDALRRAKLATECATVCQLVAEYAVARALKNNLGGCIHDATQNT